MKTPKPPLSNATSTSRPDLASAAAQSAADASDPSTAEPTASEEPPIPEGLDPALVLASRTYGDEVVVVTVDGRKLRFPILGSEVAP